MEFRLMLMQNLLILSALLLWTSLSFDSSGHWWNMGLLSIKSLTQNPSYLVAPKPLCMSVQGLSPSQMRLCQKYPDHMPIISIGVKLGLEQCHEQFQYRPWNCSNQGENNPFGPVVYKGNREAGYAHAVSAAGVVHALARGCKASYLSTCSCSETERPEQLHHDWIWGGCGDNIQYAYRFAKTFIDVREKEKSFPRGSNELAKMLMNLHNNRAGRLAVYKMASVACKCHGISASCSLRTCWTQLSPFKKIGEFLQDKYDDAKRVKFNRQGTKLRRPTRSINMHTQDDIIYIEDDQNFCEVDPSTGKTKTTGRECKINVNGQESCSYMCCGRGYRMERREVYKECNCHFEWCCKLECQMCKEVEVVTKCN